MPDLTCGCGEVFQGLRVLPLHRWVPEHDRSLGDEVVGFAGTVGMELDVYQRLFLHDSYALAPGGGWAAGTDTLVAPRQNLKTFAFEAAELTDLWLIGDELVVWTAHEFKTTQEAFRDFQQLVDNYDHLRRRVKRVYTGNGEESVELLSGARLNFMARTNRSGRGLTGDKLILDEGLELTPSMVAAAVPATSARPNSKIRVGSSAGKATSDILRGYRDRGRKGGELREAYTEYAAADADCQQPECIHLIDTPGCALDRVDLLEQANTALGVRITLTYIRHTERRVLPPAEYARERLGWWDEPELTLLIIPLDVWAKQLLDVEPVAAPLGFAVDMTPDRAWTSVGVFSGEEQAQLPEGRAVAGVIDVVEHRPGNKWLLDACKKLWERHRVPFAVDPKGPAGNEIQALKDAGIDVLEPTTEDLARACADLHDGLVDERTLFHTGKPELDSAMAGAKKRNVGDGFAWDRKKGAVISPLYAVTLARWAGRGAGEVSVYGFAQLELCDACGITPHEDPDGEHDYRCVNCRQEDE